MLSCLGGRHAAHAQAKPDIVGHRHMREQGVALKHHSKFPTMDGKMRNVAPVHENVTGRRSDEPRDATQKGRLSTAGWAQQGYELAGFDCKVDRAQNSDVAVAPGETANLDEGALSLAR